MKIDEFKYYTELNSGDTHGDWSIQVEKNCNQIRIYTNDQSEFIFIDTNRNELIALRNMLTNIIESNN